MTPRKWTPAWLRLVRDAAPVFLLGACLVGCGSKDASVPPSGPAPVKHFIMDGEVAPSAGLLTLPFQAELVLPDPVALTDRSMLEFLPMVRQEGLTQKKIEAWLLSDGEEISLGQFPAYLSLVNAGLPTDASAFLGSIVRLDLGRFKGRDAQFRWRLVGGEPGDKPEIAMFRVYKKPASELPPHVLFICSDTHRYDYALSPEGEQLMPRLTEFRKDSVTYHRASSNATWTLPSVASVMTGRYPRFHVSGRRSKSVPDPTEQAPLENIQGSFPMRWAKVVRYFTLFPSSGLETFADDLQREGYFTSWVVGNVFYSLSGLSRHGMDLTLDARTRRGGEINALASTLLDHLPTDRPNFMLVHYLDVHQFRLWNFDPRFPGEHPLTTDRENVLAAYRDAVRDSDKYLGELLDMWGRKFGFDNTLVVFFSDHGEHLRDPGYGLPGELAAARGESIEEFDLDIPLLDHGNSMDEVLLHVPLVVHYPRHMTLRGDNTDPVSLVDLYPTVLEVAGLPARGESRLDGESLLAIRRNEGRRKNPIHADYQLYGAEMSSIRDGAIKYVVTLDEADTPLSQKLVDTGLPPTDAGESGQRVENPEVTAAMEKRFKDYVTTARNSAQGLKSEEWMDMENDAKALGDHGYLKSKKE